MTAAELARSPGSEEQADGRFGLVVGVARDRDTEVLLGSGAGLVVRDIAEFDLM